MTDGSRTSRTARNAAASAVAQVLGKVATLVWTVVAARALGGDDFGAFFYALSLGLLLTAVATWGFAPVMVLQGSRDRALLPAALTRALAWETAVGVPVLAAGWGLAAPGRDGATRLAIALVLLACLLELWTEAARAASAAAQEQVGTAKALVVQRACTVLLVTVPLLAGGGLLALAGGFLAGSVVGVVTHGRALAALGVRLDRRALGRADMLAFLRLTPVLGLATVLLMALFRVDAVLLAAMRSDAEVGAYGAAYRLLEAVLFVAFSLRTAVLPVMSETGDPDLARRALERATAVLALCYLPFAAVCLLEAGPVLDLLYGPAYAEASAGALRWLAAAPLVYAVAFLGNAALQAADRFGAVLAGAAVAAALNLALNLALIPRYGGTAAAFATTAAYAVEAAVVLVALRRAGVRPRAARPLAAPALATAALVAALLLPLPWWVGLLLGGAAFAAVWAGVVRRTSPEQLALLGALTRRRA